jgi:hypothetical protein
MINLTFAASRIFSKLVGVGVRKQNFERSFGDLNEMNVFVL